MDGKTDVLNKQPERLALMDITRHARDHEQPERVNFFAWPWLVLTMIPNGIVMSNEFYRDKCQIFEPLKR